MATRSVTTWDVLVGHVTLDLRCLDRIYLNEYVPNLQVGGQIVRFLAGQGLPIPSPAVVGRIGDRFLMVLVGWPIWSTSRWCGSPSMPASST